MAKTTFNRDPYFDDYSEDKNFFQVLFQPSRAVQTRELNQLQSILAGQNEQLTDHIFKFGSMVKTGSVKYMNGVRYVRLKDLDAAGDPIDITRFVGRRVHGVSSGLRAQVKLTAAGDTFDPATIWVDYINTAVDGETFAFVNGETIQVLDDSGYVIYEAVVRCPDCATDADADTVDPTGKGSLFAVEGGSYYVYGNIVPVDYQIIYLDKYTNQPSYKVGFDVVQSIVTSDDDPTLLDNALGTPNYVAPGADRYKITLNLTKKPLDDDDDENFVSLAKCEVGVLQEIKKFPEYADLMDTLARRTYDESGDYTVTPFRLGFREHLKEDNNDGWKTEAQGGDESKFIGTLTPGKAYVRGREIQTIAEKVVEFRKARDTEKDRSTVVRPYVGNYIVVELDSASNVLTLTDTLSVDPYATDFEDVTFYDGAVSGGSPTGSAIGTARVKGMELHSGTAGTDAEWKLYLFETVFNTGKDLQDVAGVYRSGGGDQTFAANIVPDPTDSTNKIYEPINNNLLYLGPYQHTSSIRDADNPLVSNTAVTVTKKLTGAVNSSQQVIFSAEGDETFLSYDASKWIGGLQPSAGQNFAEYDLTSNVTSTPSQITIGGFAAGDIGKNFVLIIEVLKSNAREKTKSLNTVYLTGEAGDVTSISLDITDAYELVSVTDVTGGGSVDVTSNYTLVPNVKDNYYGISTIALKTGVETPTAGTLLDIEVKYFQHVGNGYYFSVDSYSAIVGDPDIDFDYEDIPTYTTNDGTQFPLSDTLDFRPTIGTDGTFTHASAVLSNLPVDESNIIFDIEYYLPRIDVLCLRETGEFLVVEGNPALEPSVPPAAENSMPLYQVIMDAYTVNVEENVRHRYLDNRRYTMRDIGRLEDRIENLEYYVTFNLLEKDTADTDVLDANGNSRFKNGFLVDNFRDFVAADTASSEFNAAIDIQEGELRPSFVARAVKLELNAGASSNYTQTSDLITLPYTESTWMEQPYATKTMSVNPYFIYEKKGEMILSPDSDVWKDVRTQPSVTVNVDTGFEAIRNIANAAGALGSTWNTWQTTNAQIESTRNARGTTTTTTSNQTRTGINRSISSRVSKRSLGSFVTSVNVIPYCRSISIQFAATDMKPNTKVYAFFDDVDVNAECRPLNGSTSDDLVTDANGNLVGVFQIPNRPDKRFFTGTRTFRLTNSPTDSQDADEIETSAEAQFFAGGMSETRRDTIISTRVPVVREQAVVQSRVQTSNRFVPSPPPPQQPQQTTINRGVCCWSDPVAQSFAVENPEGVFLTSLEVYFSAKDEAIPVWAQIREMVNGYPGPAILPYSVVHLKPENVTVSDDASVATIFTFEAPVYLAADQEYCFVVGSSSKEWRIFASKLGQTTVGANPVTVSTQPHLGSLFKSQNDKTWTAEQFEDVCFKLNYAEFDTSADMSLVFNNDSYELKSALEDNPLETEDTSQYVRVYMNNHGLVANDKVKLELLSDTVYQLSLQAGDLVTTQTLTGSTNGGTAKIKTLEYVSTDGVTGYKTYNVTFSELTGYFDTDEAFTAATTYEEFNNAKILETLDIDYTPPTHNVASGTFIVGVTSTMNGIPLSDITTPEHLVQYVDSMDSFVIQVSTPATATGRVGGTGGYALGHVQLDAFTAQMNYIDFRGDAQFTIAGVAHGAVGSTITNYTAVSAIDFIPNETKSLRTPLKVANPTNETMHLGGAKSLTVTMNGGSDSTLNSPVLNTEKLIVVSASNRIEWNSCETYSVAPNADTEGNPVECDETDPGYTGTTRWVSETDYDGGVEGAKYITNPVNLDNPATTIKMYLDVLQFLDATVEVYYRTLPVESDSEIQTVDWTLATFDQDVVSESETDFREVEVTIPADNISTLPEFKSFQVKMVLKTKNTARPAKVKNFRCLAVT